VIQRLLLLVTCRSAMTNGSSGCAITASSRTLTKKGTVAGWASQPLSERGSCPALRISRAGRRHAHIVSRLALTPVSHPNSSHITRARSLTGMRLSLTRSTGRWITSHVINQDTVAWVGQGALADRENEHSVAATSVSWPCVEPWKVVWRISPWVATRKGVNPRSGGGEVHRGLG